MKPFMKNFLLSVLMVTSVLFSTSAIAVTGKVAGGMHDFSSTGLSSQMKDSNKDLGGQICVFCHTPHNAGQTRLLWNKAGGQSNSAFRLYTASSTLSSFTKASKLSANSPSLFCLSCHDGKTAMNVLHAGGKGSLASSVGLTPAQGYPAGTTLAYGATPIYMVNPTWMFGFPEPMPNLGGDSGVDLTNDHPIGFSYTDAAGEKGPLSLNVVSALDSRIKLFGPAKNVECTSCHDPHVDNISYPLQKPFLVMENDSSKLCLSCHNK